jgi:hypothetical protein
VAPSTGDRRAMGPSTLGASARFHKRSHMRPDESAPIWQLPKDIGLAVSTKRHAKHHTQGHKSHYALLNGFTNVFLDGVKFQADPRGS